MKFDTRNISCINGNLIFPLPYSEAAQIGELQRATNGGKVLTVEVSIKRNTRSNNANSYCWALCTKIAKVIRSSKIDVYRQAIRSIGTFTPIPIQEEAAERYTQIWKTHGLGWEVEDMGKSGIPGYKILACYHGSSVYNSKEMSQLIDWLIDEATNLGISVLSEADKALLLEDWGNRDGNDAHR